MKHPFRSLLLTGPLFLLLSLFPSCAFGFGVKVGSLSVRLSDDSLRVSLRLDLGMVVARPWVSYTFTPVLRAPGVLLSFPLCWCQANAVCVSTVVSVRFPRLGIFVSRIVSFPEIPATAVIRCSTPSA